MNHCRIVYKRGTLYDVVKVFYWVPLINLNMRVIEVTSPTLSLYVSLLL